MTTALICLPFAGAGASVFRPWREHPSRTFHVVTIQLPGREERLVEDPYATMEEAAAHAAELVVGAADGEPFVLFGHSFGAILAYETARLLVAGAERPARLIVSGAAAPSIPRPYLGVAALSDDELAGRVRELVGYDHEAFHDPELRELVLPALRADMVINETYRASPARPLPVPITVLRGDSDQLVTRAAAARWSAHTTAGYELINVPGAHMYFADEWPLLWSRIDEVLQRAAA